VTLAFTVDDTINEIRSLTDEYNANQLDSDVDILPSLNRAQEKAVKILSRVYPDPILNWRDLGAVNTREIQMDEDLFEDKIVRLEWFSSGARIIPTECQRVSIRLLSQHEEGNSSVPAPDVYAIYGRTIRFNGVPMGTNNLRIWYVRDVDQLVRPWGRITDINESTQTIYLGEVSTAFAPLTTVVQGDWVRCFNVIDGQTGEVKGSFEVASWNDTDTLVIKTTGLSRATVLNRTIGTTLAGLDIGEDDYICHVKGTCVQYFFDAFHAFCVQYATAELKRKLGYAYDADQTLLKDFEVELGKTYMGRTPAMRIIQNNPNWLKGARRRFYRGFKY
jgi:hypothetical protein